MSAILSAKFKMIDEISSTLDQLGNKGNAVLAGLEDSCAKFDTAMQSTSKSTAQAASSLAKLSGDTSGVLTASKQLAVAMTDEAEKIRKSALNAQIKADLSERMATEARNHYNELKKQNEAEEHVTEAMKESEKAALKEAERLEKAAVAARKKADSAEKAADAAYENAQAAIQSAQAEDKLNSSALKTAASEKKVADALNKSEHEAEQYSDSMREAADESEKLGSKGANAGELLQDAFTALGIATTLRKIADGFIECANASIEFESAITGVYKTVDGTDEQLAKISDDIKLMSLEIPSTTTEIAGVAESAGQLGIATDDVTDFTEVMLNLGEATNLSSDEAASSLAKFSNITGMAADNYENLGSTVVALGNNFATTEADIVAMATRMASAGTLAGMTESDILGLSAAMSSVGIEAEAGGSAMSKLMTDMQVAVETGNDSLEDFASVAGMTSEQFADAFQNNAANALYAFIDGLNDVERNGETATVILENMGITEVRLSNAVKSLATNSEGLADAVDLAGEAWDENTALANEAEKRYGTLESRLTITKNAANNLKVAIGDDLTPVIGEFADMGTNALNWMTGFIEEHPKVTAGITAGAVAVGVLAVGIGGFTLAVNIAKPAVEKLTIAMTACPLFLPLTVGAGLTAGVIAFTKVVQANQETVEDYNGTLEQCRIEIEDTEKTYENICKLYGENSDAARQLADELDTLNAQYEKGGGAITEFEQKITELDENLKSSKEKLKETYLGINESEISNSIAVANLTALSEKAELTNTDLDMMSRYADYLNDTFNCNIEVNYDTGELTGFDPNDLSNSLFDMANNNRKDAAMSYLTNSDFVNDYLEAYKIQQDKFNKLNIAKSAEANYKTYNSDNPNMDNVDVAMMLDNAENEYNTALETLEAFNNTIREQAEIIGDPSYADDYIDVLAEMADSQNKVTDSGTEMNEAMTPDEVAIEAISGISDQILELSAAYDEAYNSALESFQGQFGLFDEAKANADATVENAQAALDSQLEYWNQYSENISFLADTSAESLGITQENYNALMSYVQSGNEEAAGLAQSMVDNINSGNSEAVTQLAETIGEIAAKQGEAADATAEWITDYEQKLQNYVDSAEAKIKELDMSKLAKDCAIDTVNSYKNSILAQKGQAVSAAQSLVDSVKSVFSSSNISYTVSATESSGSSSSSKSGGYATGTPYAAPGLALVGEDGPELVRFSGGEQVYTAEETMSVIMLNPEMFPTFNAYAKGTQSAAAGVALVGEEGPELVVMNGGEKVFTANQTESIFNNYTEKNLPVQNYSDTFSTLDYDNSAEYINNFDSTESVLSGTDQIETPYAAGSSIYVMPKETFTEERTEKSGAQAKDINLNINGSGSISVKSDMSKEQVVSILTDYLKPVLMNIVEQECFEEGESSYEI